MQPLIALAGTCDDAMAAVAKAEGKAESRVCTTRHDAQLGQLFRLTHSHTHTLTHTWRFHRAQVDNYNMAVSPTPSWQFCRVSIPTPNFNFVHQCEYLNPFEYLSICIRFIASALSVAKRSRPTCL